MNTASGSGTRAACRSLDRTRTPTQPKCETIPECAGCAIDYDEDCRAKVQKGTLVTAGAARNRNLGHTDLDKDLLRMPFALSWPSTLSLGATVLRVKSLV